MELLYANNGSATAANTFTAEQSIITGIANLGTTANFINAGLPVVEGGFLKVGSVIRVHVGGVFSSVAGTCTFTFALRFTSASGVVLATTTALTPATLTNALWYGDVDFFCTAVGPSTTANGRSTGVLVMENSALATGTTLTTFFGGGTAQGTPVPQTPTLPAGFDSTVPLPIVPTLALSASSGTNGVTVTDFKIYGLGL